MNQDDYDNKREPISSTGTTQDAILLMSEGNPGALSALIALLKHDADRFLGWLLYLDDMNIRGPMIWIAYDYHCERDMQRFIQAIERRDAAMIERVNTDIRRGAGGYWLAVGSGASSGKRPRLAQDYFSQPAQEANA